MNDLKFFCIPFCYKQEAMKKVVLSFLLTAFTLVGYSQIDSSKARAIKKLIEISGAEKMMVPSFDYFQKSFPKAPKEFWDEIAKENMPMFVDYMASIYNKYYSQEDIKQMIEFYNTPLGKKLSATTPLIMREATSGGQTLGKQLAEKIVKRLKENGYLD
jgi:uncharacterized protein